MDSIHRTKIHELFKDGCGRNRPEGRNLRAAILTPSLGPGKGIKQAMSSTVDQDQLTDTKA